MTYKILIAGLLVGATFAALATPALATPALATPALATPALAVAGIPEGFLLRETAAAKKDNNPETNWAIDKATTAMLVANPCNAEGLGSAGRVAARTVTYTAVPDYQKTEQLILYSSATAAVQAMADLRQAAVTCRATKSAGSSYRYTARKVALGDDGLALTGQVYYGKKAGVGGDRDLVVRRGSALLVYAEAGEWGKPAKADFTRQTRDAKRMLAKVCQVANRA